MGGRLPTGGRGRLLWLEGGMTMALFPLVSNVEGDFVLQLLPVDTDDTMDQVAAKVAVHTVGRRLPEPAGGPHYDVFLDDAKLDPSVTLGSLGLVPLQWLDVRPRA